MDIREILSAGGIEYRDSGQNVGHDFVNICCPVCHEDRFHCGIHTTGHWFKCFVNGCGGQWPVLLKHLLPLYPGLRGLRINRTGVANKYTDERVKLKKDLRKLTRELTEKDKDVYRYLQKQPKMRKLKEAARPRGLSLQQIKEHSIGVGLGQLDGYVTFQQGQNLIARRMTNEEWKPRYWKSINDGVFIFGETAVKEMEPSWVVLTEGVFDVIALPYGHGLAILGSIMSANWIEKAIAAMPESVEAVILGFDAGVKRSTLTKFELLLLDCGLKVYNWDWREFEVKDIDEIRIAYGEDELLEYIEELLGTSISDSFL